MVVKKMVELAIETTELSKRYSGEVQALESLNLKVKTGESVGYLGPNGAGKTTTIQILLNLLHPSCGEVYLFGEQMKGHEREILRRIGALIELPGYYSYLSPDQLLKHICRLYRMGHSVQQNQIKKTLEKVNLTEVRHRKISTFSTGMRRRLGIAQVLVHDPELIILDEPASGLDPKGVQEVRSIITNLNKDGKTIFMSSHNLPEVSEISNRVIFLKKGKILEDFKMSTLSDRVSTNIIEIRLTRKLTSQEKNVLENVSTINDIHYNNNVLVNYQGGIAQTHEILTELIQKKLPIYSFQPRIETLEDLYLRLFREEAA